MATALLNSVVGKFFGTTDCPESEFVRRPRSLLELERWKATEFRTFLLFSSVILKSVLPPPLYKHFLTSSVSMSILLHDDVTENEPLVDFAGQLLHHFVENSVRLCRPPSTWETRTRMVAHHPTTLLVCRLLSTRERSLEMETQMASSEFLTLTAGML